MSIPNVLFIVFKVCVPYVTPHILEIIHSERANRKH